MSFITDTFFGGNEKKAARTQARLGREAIAESRAARQEARGDLQPFRDVGGRILDPLLDFVRGGPETDLERTEGFTQIQNSAAARGKLRSGGTLRRLVEFNKLLNARNRGQRFNELFNLATLGSNAASGQATASLQSGRDIAGTTENIGNVLAAGRIGAGNARRDAVNSLLQLAF